MSILKAIISRHESSWKSLTEIDCLNHAAYLAEHQHLLSRGALIQPLKDSFRVVNQNGEVTYHKFVTLDREFISGPCGKRVHLSELCNGRDCQVTLLSNNYISQATAFFSTFLQIREFPAPLEYNQFQSWRGTPTFFYRKFLSPAEQNSNILLYFLADIWGELTLTEKETLSASQIRHLEFYCEHGSLAPLSSCFLRRRTLGFSVQPYMKFLSVDDPDNSRWEFLENFGVTLKPTLDIYIDQIRRVKRDITNFKELSQRASTLYDPLVKFCSQKLNEVKLLRYYAFKTQN